LRPTENKIKVIIKWNLSCGEYPATPKELKGRKIREKGKKCLNQARDH